MNIKYDKNFKELEIILSDFTCDKNCPYCTAKITKWPIVNDDIHMLSLYVGQLKELGYSFHYVTIGGNGEPTKHNYNKLKDIVDMFKEYDIPVKRVLTSGNIFRPEEHDKYELFLNNDWMFEVTTTDINNDNDRKVLGYNHNYFETDNFKKARIRLNYVLLKNNINHFIDDIKKFSSIYSNIETIALKLLNVNTKTNKVDNPLSEWIIENAIPKADREKIANILNKHFKYKGESFDTYSWEIDSKHEVYFSWKKVEYGLYDLVYYGNKFINYQLEDMELSNLVPKVYIASKFIKEKINDSTYTFKNDFRTTLINSEKDFVNFNNHSFIKDKNGNIKYQYIGPFYNEKASDGKLTSTICEEVVRTENALIDKCDKFIIYLDENISPGSITELIYAAFKKKEIHIFYKNENNIKYELKSSNWYPIISAMQIASPDKVLCKAVADIDEIIEEITK